MSPTEEALDCYTNSPCQQMYGEQYGEYAY